MTSLWACTERQVAEVDLRQSREQSELIDVEVNRDVDILFVIDNSLSMNEEQESLAANFSRFINVLNNVEGGLPNVHLGVVSTDLGAGTGGIAKCSGNGDNGVLQNTARGDCSPPSDRWISDVAQEDGSRSKNYTGSLADTFSCIAKLGDQGCGFEQPLEAMRRALNGSNSENDGFLRPNALLAVVIISDEDDCSTEDTRMFDTSPEQDRIDSELGFLSSFRCFEFGVQCDPDSPRSLGPRQDCLPRENSPFMYGVSEYIDFLRSLKANPADVFVAGIIGNTSNVSVIMEEGELKLAASCLSSAGSAAPGIRLEALLNAFPTRNTSTTICNEDLSDALTLIAENIGEGIDQACMNGDLELVNGEPSCVVADVRNYHKDGQEETLLAQCNAEHSNAPCFFYELDDHCADTGFRLQTERGGFVIASDTQVIAHCSAN